MTRRNDIEFNTMSKASNKDINMQTKEFKVNTLFASIDVVKYATKMDKIGYGGIVKRIRNDKDRFQVVCMNSGCLP